MIQNSIVFSFAEHFGSDIETICDITVQEIAHSYGLDHQYLCEDPMSYLKEHPDTGVACSDKSFMNVPSPCGEKTPRPCKSLELNYDCGRDTQNSVAMLADVLGFREDPTPPSLSIEYPDDGATVSPGFFVVVHAEDDIAVDRVEMYIDGVKAFSDPIPPYELVASSAVTDGMHEIEVRAFDADNYTAQSIVLDVNGLAASPNLLGGCQSGGAGSSLWLCIAIAAWLRRRR